MSLIPMVVDQTQNGERSYDIFSRMLKDRIVFFNDEVNYHTAGLAIVDTMNYISNDIVTIGMGMCASMGSVLISQGTPGKRFILPNAEIMVHQPLGGTQGQASNIEIAAKHILKTNELLTKMLADSTQGKCSYKKMVKLCDRDTWLSAEESLELGLVDKIIRNQNEIF